MFIKTLILLLSVFSLSLQNPQYTFKASSRVQSLNKVFTKMGSLPDEVEVVQPTEFLLSGLSGCFSKAILYEARLANINVERLNIDYSALFDMEDFINITEDLTYRNIRLDIKINGTVEFGKDKVEELKKIVFNASLRSTIFKTLRLARIDIAYTVTVG